jgi:hypothetical protein
MGSCKDCDNYQDGKCIIKNDTIEGDPEQQGCNNFKLKIEIKQEDFLK